jgi:hypothetical protein
MFKINLIAGVFFLLLFGYAQLQGWNLFEPGPGPKPPAGSAGRAYHK